MITGFTCGAFDPFPHPGHVRMLEEAKMVCQHLTVGLHVDPSIERPNEKHTPICTVEERRMMLLAIRHVDAVMEYQTEGELLEFLTELQPKIRILGDDYRTKPYTGQELDIPVYFATRRADWTSTKFIERIRTSRSQSGV